MENPHADHSKRHTPVARCPSHWSTWTSQDLCRHNPCKAVSITTLLWTITHGSNGYFTSEQKAKHSRSSKISLLSSPPNSMPLLKRRTQIGGGSSCQRNSRAIWKPEELNINLRHHILLNRMELPKERTELLQAQPEHYCRQQG